MLDLEAEQKKKEETEHSDGHPPIAELKRRGLAPRSPRFEPKTGNPPPDAQAQSFALFINAAGIVQEVFSLEVRTGPCGATRQAASR